MPFTILSSTSIPVQEDPDQVETGRFVSAYDGIGTFTADVKFYEAINETQEFQDIELVSYNSPISGLSITQLNAQTLRLNGIASNVIQGGYYKFLMPDNSIQILPGNTTLEFSTIIQWAIPSVKMISVTHNMQVLIKKISSNYSESFSSTQEIYWKYASSLQQFQSLLNRGIL